MPGRRLYWEQSNGGKKALVSYREVLPVYWDNRKDTEQIRTLNQSAGTLSASSIWWATESLWSVLSGEVTNLEV